MGSSVTKYIKADADLCHLAITRAESADTYGVRILEIMLEGETFTKSLAFQV